MIEPWMNTTNPAEYAEWVVVMLRHWRDQGLEMPYYSIMNEPGFIRSGIWPGAWMRDVIKILGPRLTAEGLKTKLDRPRRPGARCRRSVGCRSSSPIRRHASTSARWRTTSYSRGGETEVKQLAEQYGIPDLDDRSSRPVTTGSSGRRSCSS